VTGPGDERSREELRSRQPSAARRPGEARQSEGPRDEVAEAIAQSDWRGQLAAAAKEREHRDADLGASGSLPKLRREGRALLGSLLRPHRRQIWFVVLVVIGQNLTTMAGPFLVGLAIDHGLPDALDGNYATIQWVAGALALSAVATGLLNRLFLARAGRIGQQVLFDLRRRLFDRVQELSVSFHEKFTSGRVISRLTSDVDTLNELLQSAMDGLLTAVLNILTISVILVLLDLPLAGIVLASFIPLWFLYSWFAARSAVAFRRTRETIASLIVQFVETMNGIRAVQVFRRERRNEQIFGQLNRDYRRANASAFRLDAVFTPGVTLIGNTATVAVLVVGGIRVAQGGLDLGVLTAFLLYLNQFFGPMQDVAMFFNSLQSATAALEKIAAVMAQNPSVPEPEHPVALPAPVQGAVSFRDVEFGYLSADDGGRRVLPAFDLELPAGQTVALVGATGAGKTTIAKLIARFYDPTRGRVSLDGIDLRDLSDTDLRRAIVMVTQEGFLFSGSVADNIGFGRPDASRAEIVAAATAVGAHEFIAALPDGYDTDVRKRGGRLSAGQRQLVAFARAFLADPAVLILDEATSSLDVPTERTVQHALRTVLRDRTALIIAHRLSTVEIADRVLVLDAGQVVEDGRPDELVATGGGRFAALHESWRDSLV
jgi:ABC-type multidrug transport system fused ATPase/permease subunit